MKLSQMSVRAGWRAPLDFRTLPCRCSPARPRYLSSSAVCKHGIFKTDGSLQTFHERKILPYSQRQLYALVADVANYPKFLPFIKSSRLQRHQGRGNLEDSPWLDDQGEAGDVHTFDATLRIGVMGFDESWKSHVKCEKYSEVSADGSPSNLFKTLRTTWTLTPSPREVPHATSAGLPREHDTLSAPGQASLTALATSMASNRHADLPTLVSIDLAYEFANPLYQMMAGQAFQKVSGKIMGAFEERVQQVYGVGKA